MPRCFFYPTFPDKARIEDLLREYFKISTHCGIVSICREEQKTRCTF